MSDIGLLDPQVSAFWFLAYALASLGYLALALRSARRASREERGAGGAVMVPVSLERALLLGRILGPLARVLAAGLSLAWFRHREGPSAVPFVPISIALVLATLHPLSRLSREGPSILLRKTPARRVSAQANLLLGLHLSLLGAVWATRWSSWAWPSLGELVPEIFSSVRILALVQVALGLSHALLVRRAARWLSHPER